MKLRYKIIIIAALVFFALPFMIDYYGKDEIKTNQHFDTLTFFGDETEAGTEPNNLLVSFPTTSAIDVGLDKTKGVSLDLIENGLTKKVLEIKITKDISAQDIQLLLTESNVLLENGKLTKKNVTTESYNTYRTECSEKEMVDEINGTSYTQRTCDEVIDKTLERELIQWLPINIKSKTTFGKDTLQSYNILTKGTYRFSFNVPIVKSANGWGNAGTVYLKTNDGIYYDKQHSSDFNSSYLYRKQINVTNNANVDLVEYGVNVTFNTSALITAGKLKSNCSDMAVAVGNLTIPFGILNCNATNTQISFKVSAGVSATNSSYYIYYGSNTASAYNTSFYENYYFWYNDGTTTKDISLINGTALSVENDHIKGTGASYVFAKYNHPLTMSNWTIHQDWLVSANDLRGGTMMRIANHNSSYLFTWGHTNDNQYILRKTISGTGGSAVDTINSIDFVHAKWYHENITKRGANTFSMTANISGASISNTFSDFAGDYVGINGDGTGGGYTYWDNIIMNYDLNVLPSYTVGAEEFGNEYPQIGELNCSNGTAWKTSFEWDEPVTSCQVTCTDPDGNSLYTNFSVYSPSTSWLNRKNDTNISNYFFYDFSNLTWNNEIGVWNVTALCFDGYSSNYTSIEWAIDPFFPTFDNVSYDSIIIRKSLPASNTSINWTVIDNTTSTSWVYYNGTNYTAIGTFPYFGYNISLLSANNNTLRLYANDSKGNINSTLLDIYVALYPAISPVSNITLSPFFNSLVLNMSGNISDLNENISNLKLMYSLNNHSYFDVTTNNLSHLITINQKSILSGNVGINITVIDSYGLTNQTSFYIDINSFNMSLCTASAGDNVIMFNISMFDEINKTDIGTNASLKTTFFFWKNNKNINFTQSFDIDRMNQSQYLCFAPNGELVYTNAIFSYSQTGYSLREYYLINFLLNISSANIETLPLYTLTTGESTAITMNVIDETEQPLENTYILVQRYDIGTGNYRLVAMGKSSNLGEDLIYLQQNEAFYKFILKNDNGTILFTSTDQKITTEELYFTVTEATIADLLESYGNIVHNGITWNNDTSTFSFSYLTTDSSVTNVCLEVIRFSINPDIACRTCETSSSATLNCNIERLEGEYIPTVLVGVTKSPETWKVIVEGVKVIISSTERKLYEILPSKDGVLISLLFLITIVFFGSIYPIMAGILGVFGIIVLSVMGLINIPYSVILLIIIALIFVYLRSKN